MFQLMCMLPINFQLQPINTVPSKFNGKDVEVLNGVIADNHNQAEFALWRQLAASKITKGDNVRLNSVTKKATTYKPSIAVKFSSMRYTSVEVS